MSLSRAERFKVVLAAMVGHILEFYNFTIYAVFAVKLGELFFPSASELAQILSSLGVIAVGFVMRPVGGILFGHIGDRYGRRIALTLAVVGTAAVTFSIGILPDYNAIGIAAPILLVIFMLMLGLCVGGEGAGASIFVLEHMQNLSPGLIGGIVNAALTMGILLAVVTGLIINSMFPGSSDAWRYAFYLGGLLGIIGLYLRLSVSETPEFEKLRQENKIVSLPIRDVFVHNWRNVILTIAVGGLTGVSGYMVMTFINIFFNTIMHYDATTSLFYGVIGNLLLIGFLPLMGLISDRVGYSRTMLLSAMLVVMFSIPLFILLTTGNTTAIIAGIFGITLLAAGIYAPLYPFMLGLFTPEQRYSGIACSLNIGIAMFGGSSSVICVALAKYTGINYMPALYWSMVCIVFFTAFACIRKTEFKRIIQGKPLLTEETLS